LKVLRHEIWNYLICVRLCDIAFWSKLRHKLFKQKSRLLLFCLKPIEATALGTTGHNRLILIVKYEQRYWLGALWHSSLEYIRYPRAIPVSMDTCNRPSALLGLTLIHPTLRSLKRYRAIMIIIFLLDIGRLDWVLIPFIHSSALWTTWTATRSVIASISLSSKTSWKGTPLEFLFRKPRFAKAKVEMEKETLDLKEIKPLVGKDPFGKKADWILQNQKPIGFFSTQEQKSHFNGKNHRKKSSESCCLQNRQCRCLRRCRSSRRLLNPLGSHAHNNHK